MVFGLSSSKSRQRGTHQRSSAIGKKYITSRKAGKQAESRRRSTSHDSKRRGNRDQKNDNHCQRDEELGEHGANVPEQTSPPSAASVNHALARNDFTDDRANHRTNEQADQAEEQSD